ncbi:MAG: RelA/SpoT AH/RIS domain-containing protein, partial [Myxococcota bacterium]
GDVKTFPRGATPLDFAYSVHSEVGNRCSGAKVNGVMVPLRHKLRNGDVVEVLTNKNQHPSKDWLDIAVTSRARSRIRNYLRAEERKRSVKLGHDLVERALHKKDLSFSRWQKKPEKALKHFKLNHLDELFAQVAYGKIDVRSLIDAIAPKEEEAPKRGTWPPGGDRDSLKPTLFEKTIRRVVRRDDEGIRIDGMDDILVRFARCCNPVPGDAVMGWITRGRGVTVHRRNCSRVHELDPARRVDVSWARSAKAQHPVSLRVTTNNRPGILAQVSTVFTDHGLNISEATCRTNEDGRAVNLFQFAVADLDRLRTVMRGIAKIRGVKEVERL